jgi:hypothetical protein
MEPDSLLPLSQNLPLAPSFSQMNPMNILTLYSFQNQSGL